MLRNIKDYIEIVGEDAVSAICKKAKNLRPNHVCHINSTFLGGGVAEILSRLIPLMSSAGGDDDWQIINGNPAFFDVTKKFHNALQGDSINLSQQKKSLYLEINKEFSSTNFKFIQNII